MNPGAVNANFQIETTKHPQGTTNSSESIYVYIRLVKMKHRRFAFILSCVVLANNVVT